MDKEKAQEIDDTELHYKTLVKGLSNGDFCQIDTAPKEEYKQTIKPKK